MAQTAFKSGLSQLCIQIGTQLFPYIEEMHTDKENQQAVTDGGKPFEDNVPTPEKGLYSKQQADNQAD